MKALKFMVVAVLLFFAYGAQAQNPAINSLDNPPSWGPEGYTDVRYYYLPDCESYYDILAEQFVVQIDGKWLHKSRLPSMYKKYDLYEGYKVVMTEYTGNAPYKFFDEHKEKYPKGYQGPEQKTIGEKPGK